MFITHSEYVKDVGQRERKRVSTLKPLDEISQHTKVVGATRVRDGLIFKDTFKLFNENGKSRVVVFSRHVLL